jgi:hypothetical protein
MPRPATSRAPPHRATTRPLMPLRSGHRHRRLAPPPPCRVGSPAHTGRATTPAADIATRPYLQAVAHRQGPPPTTTVWPPLLTVHGPTSLHAGTLARAPPLHGASTTASCPCHLGTAAGCRCHPGTGASNRPHHLSRGYHPHYHTILLRCRRGVRRPHCPVVHQGSRNLHLHLHYSIWIVVECI